MMTFLFLVELKRKIFAYICQLCERIRKQEKLIVKTPIMQCEEKCTKKRH